MNNHQLWNPTDLDSDAAIDPPGKDEAEGGVFGCMEQGWFQYAENKVSVHLVTTFREPLALGNGH